MRTCSYLFLTPILSQEGNGDVTNLAVRDDAVTKPVQRVARHRTRTMQVPMHFTFTIARSGCVVRSLFSPRFPIASCDAVHFCDALFAWATWLLSEERVLACFYRAAHGYYRNTAVHI